MIQNGVTRMVSVKNQDSISKLLDMIPDFVDKFMKKIEAKKDPEKRRPGGSKRRSRKGSERKAEYRG